MSKSFLLKLPGEIINEIINRLAIEDQLKLFISCKKINDLSKNNNIEYYSAIQIYKYYLKFYKENKLMLKWIQKFPPANRQTHLIHPIMGGVGYVFAFVVLSFLMPLLFKVPLKDCLEVAKKSVIFGVAMASVVLLIACFFINDLRIEYFIMKHFYNAKKQIFFYKTDNNNNYYIDRFYFNPYRIDIPTLILKLNKIDEALTSILPAINEEREFVSRKYKLLETKSNFFKIKPLEYQNPTELRKPQLSSSDYANVSLYRYLANKHEGLLPKLFKLK